MAITLKYVSPRIVPKIVFLPVKASARSNVIKNLDERVSEKIRSAAPAPTPQGDEMDGQASIDGYAGEILEGDDDDSGWMAHTLQFRKDATMDQHHIDEYEVIDPRTQVKTLEDAKRQEARLKRHSEQSGRLTAGASARAERDLRGRDNAGGRNNGRERH